MPLYHYQALITRLVDADTALVSVDCGFSVWLHDMRIRFAALNAPELSTQAGKAALAYLAALVGPLPVAVTLDTIKDRQDTYGRYLGVFTLADGTNVNMALLSSGHAVPYP